MSAPSEEFEQQLYRRIPAAIYAIENIPMTAKVMLIHVCLKLHENNGRPIWASALSLSAAIGTPVPAVKKALRSLCSAQHLLTNGWDSYWPSWEVLAAYGEPDFKIDLQGMPPFRQHKATLPAAKTVKAGYVYLMLNKRNGYYKIGFSVNPNYREKTLQAEEPEIVMLHSFSGTTADEKRLHLQHDAGRIRGEWFNLSAAQVAAILNHNGAE